MRKLGKGVAHGGTYTAHPVSLAAADQALWKFWKETDALERIAAYGARLREGHASDPCVRAASHTASSATPQ